MNELININWESIKRKKNTVCIVDSNSNDIIELDDVDFDFLLNTGKYIEYSRKFLTIYDVSAEA